MKSNLFGNVIESNKKFWSNLNNQDDRNGYLLYEMFYSEPAMIYGISKTALTIANIKGLKPICIRGLRGRKDRFSLNSRAVGSIFNLFVSSSINSFSILKHYITINSKERLLNLKIDNCNIGHHIYDAILRKFNLSEINEFNFKIKKTILLELSYFYFFKELISKYVIKTILLGDNVVYYLNWLKVTILNASHL